MRRITILPIIVLAIMVVFGACSTEDLLQETKSGITSGAERTLSLTALMPKEPTTRVDLEQNADKSIDLTWETGDELQLVFVQRENKIKQTVTVNNISEDGKKASFGVILPEASTGFDVTANFKLYGVYGGGGIAIREDSLLAILPYNLANATSLAGEEATSIKNRKDVMLYFEYSDIDVDNLDITVTFKHLGSLFCVSLQNVGNTILEEFLGVDLVGIDTSNESWAYNTDGSEHSYNLETHEFQNKEAAGNSIFFKAAQNSLSAQEIITIWGWYPPLTDKIWPELKLALTTTTADTIMSTNSLPARMESTPAGMCYYFYATWDGTSINFTNNSFSNEYIVHVETRGTLDSLLSSTQKANTTKLTVTGQINKDDYNVMKSKMPKLTYLDLSNAESYDGEIENRIPSFAFGDAENPNQKIAAINLPKDITSIGDSAFYKCGGLSGILNIPEGVTSIEDGAFNLCFNFTGNLILPDGLTKIGANAFSNCIGFTGDLIIPDGVTTIEEGAFWSCFGFTGNLILPTQLTAIESQAFAYCGGFTGDLVIPDAVSTIGYGAFYSCSGFTGDLILPNQLIEIGSYAFCHCSGFTGNLVIPDGVTTIEGHAFYGCSGFTGNLVLPDQLTEIGTHTFFQCSGFTGDLIIPDNVSTIGMAVFYKCSGFTGNLILPTQLTEIGIHAFSGCSGFTGNLNLPIQLTKIGGYAFYYCSSFTGDLIIPDGVTTIGDFAFQGCSNFNGNLILSDQLTEIGTQAFTYCSGFTGDLVIPDGVTTIRNFVFYECSGFTGNLNLPTRLTKIGGYAFYYCSGFTGDLIIPDGVTTIGEFAFQGCSNFNGNLILPNQLTEIGVNTFSGCNGFIGDVTFPDGVTIIAAYAFSDCYNVDAFQFPHTTPIQYNFAMFERSIPIKVPNEAVSTYQSTDGWKEHTIIGY